MRAHSPSTHFTTLRLRADDDASWAVVGQPSGAIATGCDGRLLMRLSGASARMIAAELSGQTDVNGRQDCPAAKVATTAARSCETDGGVCENVRPPDG